MLADLVDHVIGVDPDKDSITIAIVEAGTTRVVDTARFPANRDGYTDAIVWAEGPTCEGERAWAIEGSASFGRGLTVALSKLAQHPSRPPRAGPRIGTGSTTAATGVSTTPSTSWP